MVPGGVPEQVLDSTPSRLLLDTGIVRVGRFHIHPSHPNFAREGQIHRHEFVFPRTSVWIEHPGRRPFVADPTTVTFYNRGQPYARRPLSPEGDRCDWYAVDAAVLAPLARAIDPGLEDRPDRPFRFTHGPVDAVAYARQRLVSHHVSGAEPPDPLFVEEQMIGVLARLLRLAYAREQARAARLAPPAEAVELVERARTFASAHVDERLTLARFAAATGATPFRLCHAFHAVTGGTLHAWLVRLRLQLSLERVAEPFSDLTTVALDLGFSSHSHFTAAFRRAFGLTPSAFRRAAGGREIRAAAARLAGYSGSSSRAGSGRKKLAASPIA
jgi:AraC-like DNA-binding protein